MHITTNERVQLGWMGSQHICTISRPQAVVVVGRHTLHISSRIRADGNIDAWVALPLADTIETTTHTVGIAGSPKTLGQH